MVINIYAIYASGGSARDDNVFPTYNEVIRANARIEEFFLKEGFNLIDGCYETIPSKGIPLRTSQTFLKMNTLVETGFKTDRKRDNRALLSVGIAIESGKHLDLVKKIFYNAAIPIELCPDSKKWPKADLELFRSIYHSIIKATYEPKTISTL